MIITGFDGRNVQLIADAVEVKALVLALSMLIYEDYDAIADCMELSGFKLDGEDIRGLLHGANVLLSQYANAAKPFSARPINPKTGEPEGENKESIN